MTDLCDELDYQSIVIGRQFADACVVVNDINIGSYARFLTVRLPDEINYLTQKIRRVRVPRSRGSPAPSDQLTFCSGDNWMQNC